MKILYSLIIFAALLSACQNSQNTQPTSPDLPETEESEIMLSAILQANPAIKIGNPEKKLVQRPIHCTGRIEVPPTDLISVHSKSGGFIEQIHYLPGDHVKKGATLFTISNPGLIEKQRLFMEAKAEFELAEKEFDRQQILNSDKASSQKNYDAAMGKRDLLLARYKGLKSELGMLGVNTEKLEKDTDYQTGISVYAVDHGFVHEVLVNRGQNINPEDQLMDIADDDHLHLELQVLSRDVPLLKIGQKVKFRLPNDDAVYKASIVKLNPMLDPHSGTLNVHCHIDGPDNTKVKAGMFVNAEIEASARELNVLSLEAVIKEGENYFAYMVRGDKLEKELLKSISISEGFVILDSIPSEQMVIAGAYYIE